MSLGETRNRSFDAREATIKSVHQALHTGSASCRDIVEAFLARIELYNPQINAVLGLNPGALQDADALDAKIAQGQASGALLGVPILLKDNFDAVGMPTTAGSLALRDAWPQTDAPVVAALRRAGAIVLGKANLHELALEGLTVSSLGGQTRNPYDLTRTPGGSSGGSGAAVAASFAVMATGSDTVNSLRSPASANSLYSFRPTRDLISREGILPVSSTQDSVGMIGRSLHDIATALTVMAETTNDHSSGIPNNLENTDYAQAMQAHTSTDLESIRVGILQSFIESKPGSETSPVSQIMSHVQSLLEAEGATVMSIDDAAIFDAPTILSEMDVQTFEIRDLVDAYLSSSNLKGTHPIAFADVFSSQSSPGQCASFLVCPAQSSYIRTALTSSVASQEYTTRKARIEDLTNALHKIFSVHRLDAILYPQQRNLVVSIGSPSQHGRNGILAAVTGSPVICIPVGFSAPTSTAPIGLPIGMEILGMPWTEYKLFEVAKAIDLKLAARKAPTTVGLSNRVEVKNRYENVPDLVPMGLHSVDIESYPPGQI